MGSNELLAKNEINFLMEISKVLLEEMESGRIVNSLNSVFQKFYQTKEITFAIWDATSSRLRDFSTEWGSMTENQYNDSLYDAYEKLKLQGNNKFIFNDKSFDFNLSSKGYEKIKILLSSDSNVIYFPILSKGELKGIICIQFGKLSEEIVFGTNFFSVYHLALTQISTTIINHILKEQMELSLNFYEAMKDIAKIIESQYELAYIIPLIGEMIDRFISAHLIYIFIRNEGKYELLWPNACKDREISALLDRITLETEYIISDNKKIGVFPLINENTILGAIVAYSNVDVLMQKELEYLLQLSKQSSTTIQRANVYAEVLKYATLDALTGLNNRRQFETRLNQEIATSRRKNTPLCCMMLDVDYFKKVNDTYGHSAGDCVLKAVSQLITKEIREYDIASRYGGEEFFILLPQTSIGEANFVAQRLRKAVEESKMDISEAKVPGVSFLKVTVSIGVSDFDPEESSEDFYQNADKALYDAKNRGRNKVVVFNRSCECSL